MVGVSWIRHVMCSPDDREIGFNNTVKGKDEYGGLIWFKENVID